MPDTERKAIMSDTENILRQRLASLEADSQSLVEENHRLVQMVAKQAQTLAERDQRIRELDGALSRRLVELLELKAVLDLRGELGPPEAAHPRTQALIAMVDCQDTLSLEDTAARIGAPAGELDTFLDESEWPLRCGTHGTRVPENMLQAVKDSFNAWVLAMFTAQLKNELPE